MSKKKGRRKRNDKWTESSLLLWFLLGEMHRPFFVDHIKCQIWKSLF